MNKNLFGLITGFMVASTSLSVGYCMNSEDGGDSGDEYLPKNTNNQKYSGGHKNTNNQQYSGGQSLDNQSLGKRTFNETPQDTPKITPSKKTGNYKNKKLQQLKEDGVGFHKKLDKKGNEIKNNSNENGLKKIKTNSGKSLLQVPNWHEVQASFSDPENTKKWLEFSHKIQLLTWEEQRSMQDILDLQNKKIKELLEENKLFKEENKLFKEENEKLKEENIFFKTQQAKQINDSNALPKWLTDSKTNVPYTDGGHAFEVYKIKSYLDAIFTDLGTLKKILKDDGDRAKIFYKEGPTETNVQIIRDSILQILQQNLKAQFQALDDSWYSVIGIIDIARIKNDKTVPEKGMVPENTVTEKEIVTALFSQGEVILNNCPPLLTIATYLTKNDSSKVLFTSSGVFRGNKPTNFLVDNDLELKLVEMLANQAEFEHEKFIRILEQKKFGGYKELFVALSLLTNKQQQ